MGFRKEWILTEEAATEMYKSMNSFHLSFQRRVRSSKALRVSLKLSVNMILLLSCPTLRPT